MTTVMNQHVSEFGIDVERPVSESGPFESEKIHSNYRVLLALSIVETGVSVR